jgi:vacuolar-type H+-ATPase subunit I/STV1
LLTLSYYPLHRARFAHAYPESTTNTRTQIANVVIYFLFLGSNVYSVAGGHVHKPPLPSWTPLTVRPCVQHAYRPKQTYITPASWTFGIWSLIHLLLLGFIFYQFTDAGRKVAIEGIGWRFTILGIVNAVFVSLWASGLYIPAFAVSFLVAAAVSNVYWIVKKRYQDHKIGNEGTNCLVPEGPQCVRH